ncbi:VOC family protein [Kitasatospora sp. NPDC127067]|uniref:VOC family protein n=1 Tax=Kitasatospora sp. NPDC127067 TaxID=3347126 RepID=UPI00366A407F
MASVKHFQVTFDCAEPERVGRFWCEALGYVPPSMPEGFDTREDHQRSLPPEDRGSWFAASDPEGVGPSMYFQSAPEGKVVKNRVHLDVWRARRTPTATRSPDHHGRPDRPVLADELDDPPVQEARRRHGVEVEDLRRHRFARQPDPRLHPACGDEDHLPDPEGRRRRGRDPRHMDRVEQPPRQPGGIKLGFKASRLGPVPAMTVNIRY